MAATPTLKAKLTLSNNAFASGLRGAEKLGLKFGSNLMSKLKGVVTSPLAFIAGAIGAAFSFNAFKSGIEGAIESGAELERLSRVTGVAVGSLAMLSPVFRNAGVDSALMSTGLVRMERAIFNAAKAGYGGQKTFRELGLKFDDLAKQKPEEQFKAIGSAIAKLPNAAARTGVAMALFGRSGAELLPVFMELADTDFGKLSEKAKILEANAAQFHRTTVAMKTARVNLNNVFLGSAVVLAPLIEQLGKVISSQNALAFGTTLGNGIRAAVDEATGAFMHPEKFTDALSNGLQGAAADFGNTVAGTLQKAGADFGNDLERHGKLIAASLRMVKGGLTGNRNDTQGGQAEMDDANVQYKLKHDAIFARPDEDMFGAKGFYAAAKKSATALMNAGHEAIEEATREAVKESPKKPFSTSTLTAGFTGLQGASMALGTNDFAKLFSPGGGIFSNAFGPAYGQTPILSAHERRQFEMAAVGSGGQKENLAGFGAFHKIRAGDHHRAREYARSEEKKKLTAEGTNERLDTLITQVGDMTRDFVN